MSQALLFLDLDDTIFQTKRKRPDGIVPGTETENPENVSYLTPAQKTFFNILSQEESLKIIPVTARDFDQYQRTFISDHPEVDIAAINFAGQILQNDQPDPDWQSHIQKQYNKMDFPIEEAFQTLDEDIDSDKLRLITIDDYYLGIKSIQRDQDYYEKAFQEIREKFKEQFEEEYFVHQNANNLSFIPKFINKEEAVTYLTDKFEPKLTIGMGDSISDLSFMQACDFSIFPNPSQIGRLIPELLNF